MSFQQPIYSSPPLPPKLLNANSFQDIRDGAKEYLTQLKQFQDIFFVQLTNNHNRGAQGFDPNVASAATIQVGPNLQQIVTGTNAIDTVTPPKGFNGFKALYSRDGFSLTAAGNIATAISVPAGEAVLLMYFPPTLTWGVIASFFAGTLPANSVGTSQLQNSAVTTAKIANQAVGTSQLANAAVGTTQLANAAVTTAILAAGAATEGATFTDNSSQNISPYLSAVSVISGAVTVNATTDFVTGQVTLGGNSSNIQSNDQLDYVVTRGATTIASGTLKLTLSTTTVVGGTWSSTLTFEDSGVSGSQTYAIKLTTTNGSGNGTYAVTKTAASMQIVDHRAQ